MTIDPNDSLKGILNEGFLGVVGKWRANPDTGMLDVSVTFQYWDAITAKPSLGIFQRDNRFGVGHLPDDVSERHLADNFLAITEILSDVISSGIPLPLAPIRPTQFFFQSGRWTRKYTFRRFGVHGQAPPRIRYPWCLQSHF